MYAFFIEIQLIYNVVLISDVQESDSVYIYIYNIYTIHMYICIHVYVHIYSFLDSFPLKVIIRY